MRPDSPGPLTPGDRRRLADLRGLGELPKGRTAEAVIEEILGLQLETDCVRRRAILWDHLRKPDSELVWDDEYGIV